MSSYNNYYNKSKFLLVKVDYLGLYTKFDHTVKTVINWNIFELFKLF